ncbi:hypothetical protein ATCC90586_000612 [Pythium insidiosum]|nr:hypothetical protein ATCC90586_000612 [Pythium insidiosum]
MRKLDVRAGAPQSAQPTPEYKLQLTCDPSAGADDSSSHGDRTTARFSADAAVLFGDGEPMWARDSLSPPVLADEEAPVATRFVAGDAFFNFTQLGSLRPGGTVSLLSRDYVGYAVAAFLSGYIYVAVNYLLLRVSDAQLPLSQSEALRGLLTLEWTIVLVVGVASDCLPMSRARRLPFMVVAWAVAALSWLALSVALLATRRPGKTVSADLAASLVGLAFLALIVATSAMDIRILELSQQEHLRERGRLLGTYQMLRIAGQVVMHVVIALLTKAPSAKSAAAVLALRCRVDLVVLHLALLSVVPVVALLYCSHEVPVTRSMLSSLSANHHQQQQHYDGHARARGDSSAPVDITLSLPSSSIDDDAMITVSPTPAPLPVAASKAQLHRRRVSRTLRSFWRSAQQKVVWQLVLFNCAFSLFAFFEIGELRRALQIWTRESQAARLARNVLGDVAFVAALALWRVKGLNANWRWLTAGVVGGWTVVFAVSSSLIVYGVVRTAWLQTLTYVLRAPLRALSLLVTFVPAIEIAHVGTEGSTLALLSSFKGVMRLATHEVSTGLLDAWPALRLEPAAVRQDAAVTRQAVFCGLWVVTGATLFSLTWLGLLPRQKLDAQQLRVYGGYSRLPVLALVAGYVLGLPLIAYLHFSRHHQ